MIDRSRTPVSASCRVRGIGVAVSADGKTLLFTCKDAGREEAWSTNYDLWEVPTDGSAAPKRITTNPAWDATPRNNFV